MNRLLAIVLLFLCSCSEYSIKTETSDLKDSINHAKMIEIVKIRKQLDRFKIDSMSKYALQISSLNSMKVVNIKNKMERVTDSLIKVVNHEHALINELSKAPKDSIIFDTIFETVVLIDTVHYYDTVHIGLTKKGVYYKLKNFKNWQTNKY